MKLKSHTYLAIVLCTIFGCQKPEGENIPSADNVLTLKMSAESLVLSLAEEDENALTFTWSTGTNYGTGKAILYSLNFAKADEEYSPQNAINLGKHQYSATYTAGELNEILLKIIPMTESGKEMRFKAMLTAVVPDEEKVQTSEVEFTVTTYRPIPEQMNISGSALGNTSDTSMHYSDNGVFVWQGELESGVITVNNIEYGIEITTDVTENGRYTIFADLKDDTIDIQPAGNIYFVCEEDGWEFTMMEEKSPGIHTIVRDLKSGQFKFGTIPDVWHYMYVSAENDNAPWDSKDATFIEGSSTGNDWKWFIWNSEPVPYEICLDLSGTSPEMVMTPYNTEISMVGDATSGGWSLDDRTKMERGNVMEFRWSGRLVEGELKFCCGNAPEFGKGEWFMPEIDQTELSSVQDSEICLVNAAEEGAPDRKWKITEPGDYSLTLNQYTHTLTISKN